jgi:hypothetical protein
VLDAPPNGVPVLINGTLAKAVAQPLVAPSPPAHQTPDSTSRGTAATPPFVLALPCLPSMVPGARFIARNLLAACPRVQDAEQITGELIASSVRYSQPAAFFELTSACTPAGCASR